MSPHGRPRLARCAGVHLPAGPAKGDDQARGENIAPVEVETALAAHPEVVECAVAPVPDDDMGEEIKAYVVRRDARAVAASELASYLTDRLARFKVPRYWEFRDVLPHTPSERIAKHELEQGRADFRDNTVDLKV